MAEIGGKEHLGLLFAGSNGFGKPIYLYNNLQWWPAGRRLSGRISRPENFVQIGEKPSTTHRIKNDVCTFL